MSNEKTDSSEMDKELRAVAQSIAKGEYTEAAGCLILDDLATKYANAGPETDKWKRLRRSFDSALKACRGNKAEKCQPTKPKAPEPEFTREQAELAKEIEQGPNPAGKLAEFLAKDGYMLTPMMALMMLLISGFPKINPITWKKTGSLKGTQTLCCGPHGSGKTEFLDKLLYINDADPFYPNGVVCRIGSSSSMGLLFSAGDDGTEYQNKIIGYEEVNPDSPFTQLIWATTTSGAYTHVSSSENKRSGRREGTKYHLNGPLHHIMTSVRMPHCWDPQFISRTIRIEFALSAETRLKVVRGKLAGAHRSVDSEEIYIHAKAWNLFLQSLKRVDPADRNAFADVDMSVFTAHALSLVNRDSLCDDDPRRMDVLMMLIASHAIIHQHHREKRQQDGRLILVATADDINGVVEPFNRFVPPTNKIVSTADSAAFRLVAFALRDAGSMTKHDVEFVVKKGERTVSDYLKAWRDAGLLRISEVGPRGEHRYEFGQVWDKAKYAITKIGGEINLALRDDDKYTEIIDRALEIASSHAGGFMLEPIDPAA